jgi:hypothetical protein
MNSSQMTLAPQLCGDCDAVPGQRHNPGCDVERCMLCGGQCISCDCIYRINDLPVNSDEMKAKYPQIYDEGPTDAMFEKYDAEVVKVGGPEIWNWNMAWSEGMHQFWVVRETGSR